MALLWAMDVGRLAFVARQNAEIEQINTYSKTVVKIDD